MDSADMEESRREAAIKLGLTPDQVKGLESQAVRSGDARSGNRPIVPMEKPLPSGDTGKYKWRQTGSEVEILVPIGENIKARDVSWSVTDTTITVGVKGREALKNAKMVKPVNKFGNHVWCIDTEEGQRYILATIEKLKLHEEWSAIEADPSEADNQEANAASSSSASAPPQGNSTNAAPAPAAYPTTKTADESVKDELAKVKREIFNVQEEMAKLRKKEASLQTRQKELEAKLTSSS